MRLVLAGTAGLLVGMLLVGSNAAAQRTATFKGEITDEKLVCINTPLKPTDYFRTGCVLNQVHHMNPPSKYVLYDEKTKTVYHLDDQHLVQPYAAAKVEVTGTLDAATKTIKVASIKTDDAAYRTGTR